MFTNECLKFVFIYKGSSPYIGCSHLMNDEKSLAASA